MHDWYTPRTLVDAPTSSLIGTCFVELAYMYWCMVDVLSWYMMYWVIWWDTWLIEIHDCDTWFMVETYLEWYDSFLMHMAGILVDAHGWHDGRGIWLVHHWHMFLAYGWYIPLMISYGIFYGIDVHGWCTWVLWMVGTQYGTCCTWLMFFSWFSISLLTYLFLHDVWYGMILMHGQVQGSS